MPNLSYQLYSSRNFGPLSKTFKMLSGLGYENVEGYGGIFDDPERLSADLNVNGLAMATTHLGLDQVEGDPDSVVAMAKTVGIETIYVPFLNLEERPSDGPGWSGFGRRLAKAGTPLREAGIGFGWHNHDFEFLACADGAMPIEAMLDGGPDLELELDIAWVVRAGEDAIRWINTLKDRLTAVHVKDIAPAGECEDEDGWADVGHGVLGWASINAALEGSRVHTAVVEHDNPNDDERFARRSFDFVSVS